MDAADRAAWQAARAALGRRRYDWNEARVALLARRWAEGASASMIALELDGVSRSAVLGKIFRLKLRQPDTKLRRICKNGRPRRVRARKRPQPISRIALQAVLRALDLEAPARRSARRAASSNSPRRPAAGPLAIRAIPILHSAARYRSPATLTASAIASSPIGRTTRKPRRRRRTLKEQICRVPSGAPRSPA